MSPRKDMGVGAPVLASPEYSIAESFRDHLLSDTSDRRKITIERLWIVCSEMFAADEIITVAEVGRRVEARFGGPKTQSIRDQPDRLKKLVELCANVRQPEIAPRRDALSDSGIIHLVADPTVKARIRLLLENCARYKHEALLAKKALLRLQPVGELTSEQCYETLETKQPQDSQSSVELTSDEKQSIRDFLDPEFLYGEGFRVDETLGLLNDSLRIIMPKIFIIALRKAACLPENARTMELSRHT